MLTSTNAKVIEESSKAIHDCEKRMSEAVGNVDKLHQEVKEFMNDFRISSEKNTSNMNKVIKGFLSSLKAEKEAL